MADHAPVKQAFTSLPGVPERDDPEVNVLMDSVLRLTLFGAYEIIRSLLRCALAAERKGNQPYMTALAADALMSVRLLADPETAAALEAARSLRPAGPERSVDVSAFLAERGLIQAGDGSGG